MNQRRAAMLTGLIVALLPAVGVQAEPRRAVLLDCELPGHSPELLSHLEQVLGRDHQVRRIGLDVLLGPDGLTQDPPDLLVLPNAAVVPAQGAAAVEAYLRTGGDLLALRTPLSLHAPVQIGGEWLDKHAYLHAQAGVLPEHVLFDFAGSGGFTGWDRVTNHPEWTTTARLVPDQPASGLQAVHVQIADLEGWDTFAAPGRRRFFPPGHTLMVLAAKGTTKTSSLAIECEEEDGSRWLATLPLTPEWKRMVVAPEEFRYWPSNPKRGGPNDRLDPAKAVVLKIGLAFSHTGPVRGPHEYWLGPIGTAARTRELDQLIGDFGLPVLDTICPSYKLFECSQVTGLFHISISDVWALPLPQRVRSPHPRPGGGGYDKGRTWRWMPLIETDYVAGSNSYGTPATLLAHADGPYKGGFWASFGIDDEAWYLAADLQELLAKTLRIMREKVIILDGGADKYTYFKDQSMRLGTRVANLGKHPFEGTAEVRLTDRGTAHTVHAQSFTLSIPPGETLDVSEIFKPTAPEAAELGYACSVEVMRGDKLLDRVEHRVHVWEPRPLAERQYVTIEDGNFMLAGKRWRAHGINYMPSSGIGIEDQQYFEYWTGRRSYDPVVIQRDLETLKQVGYNSVSVFTDHRVIEAQNMVDLIHRCEELGLKVNLSLRPGTPMDFPWPKVKEMIESMRLAENDTVFAYDLAWEPHFGRQADRVIWDRDWEAWIVERYGSVEHAEADWGFAAPRDTAGRITNPSSEQVMSDGPWRRMVAGYRRFLDTLLYRKYEAARRLVRSIDPHHFVSFRMTEAGNPTCRWDGIVPYDFPYLVHAVDFLAPEAYGRIGDWEQVKPGWFQLEYGRWADADKPFIWSEQGMSTWGTSSGGNCPDLLERQAEFYRAFYRMMIASGADGIYSWWYPGGFRYNENSDYGIINPDGTDRPVTRVIRESAQAFLEGPDPRPIDTWIEFDRDPHPDGIAGAYDVVKEQFWAAIAAGRTPGLRTAGTGTTSRDCPPLAVGNTPANGLNPQKYLDAAFDVVEYQAEDGRWVAVAPGNPMRVGRAGETLVRLRVSVTNLGEATWLAGQGQPAAPESIGAVFFRASVGNQPTWIPLVSDLAKGRSLQDVALDLHVPAGSGAVDLTLRMEAVGRGLFGGR